MTSLTAWATFPSAAPVWPLDAIFASIDLAPAAVATVGDDASDHRGLAAHLVSVPGGDLAAARARHLSVRRRQLERILRCDLPVSTHPGREWLVTATGFGALVGDPAGDAAERPGEAAERPDDAPASPDSGAKVVAPPASST
jgi:hypothetical protein